MVPAFFDWFLAHLWCLSCCESKASHNTVKEYYTRSYTQRGQGIGKEVIAYTKKLKQFIKGVSIYAVCI